MINNSRRKFIKTVTLGSMTTVGVAASWLPRLFAQDDWLAQKKLTILSERPLTGETPMHLLDAQVTPTSHLFIRNNGLLPTVKSPEDIKKWRLKISGEVTQELSLSLQDLKTRFKQYSYQLVLECGGNGRAGQYPPASGSQWTYGGVGCPLWQGVRLKDVLSVAGIKKSATFIAYYSEDIHPSGNINKDVISRGCHLAKALEDTTLITTGVNNSPLPLLHGFPARLICPGLPGSASGKWLKHLWVRDRIHDGAKMTGQSYRMPRFPVAPGSQVADNDMDIITQMPVKSIITFPTSQTKVSYHKRQAFRCRGFAWSGAGKIIAVDMSYDFGQTWHQAKLSPPVNNFAWQRWQAQLPLPSKGYFELWARSKDITGKMQPMVVPGWNPSGYLNNAMPRIAVEVV